MKEKSNGRDRNEKVKIAQSNNSIFGGGVEWLGDSIQKKFFLLILPSSLMGAFIFPGHAN